MTTTLTKYEAAKHALAEARSVDEVKDIRDKSIALKLYAKQAKDKKLEADAHEIRVRAERRLGQMIGEQKKSVGLNKGGKSEHRNRVSKKPGKPTLASQGIDKNLADRSRKAAAMPEQQFEIKVQQARESISTPLNVKIVSKDQKPKKVLIVGDAVDQCVSKLRAVIEDGVHQMRRGGAEQKKFERLFAAVRDLIDDLENKTLPPKSVEERRALNARLAEVAPAE